MYKLKNIIIFLFLCMAFFETVELSHAAGTRRKLQFAVIGGIDKVDVEKNADGTAKDSTTDATKRTGSAGFLRLMLSTKPIWIRISSSFTFLSGSSYMQAEFNIGGQIYFLSYLFKRGPVEPYFFAEGSIGAGRYNEESRYDFGWEGGAGLDLRLGRKSGLTFGGAVRSATETAYRYWGGVFSQF